MSTECIPIATLPHTTRLFRDFLAMGESADSPVRAWYGAEPFGSEWMKPAAASTHSTALADALERQSRASGAGRPRWPTSQSCAMARASSSPASRSCLWAGRC